MPGSTYLFQAILLPCALVTAAFFYSGCARVAEPTIVDSTAPQVSPTLQNSSRYVLKHKVVVARFSNETTYGKSVLLQENNNMMERQASDTLYARLAKAQKFILFEWSDSQKIFRALENRSLHTLGLPADYLIVGSVNEFGRETVGKTGAFSRSKAQRAYAKVNVRLVDVKTSQVIFATEGAGEAISEVGTVLGIGTTASYDSTLNDKAISAAISKVVSNLVENLLEKPWRSYVLCLEERDGEQYIVIGGGPSQGLSPGHRLAIWQRGQAVANPQTGMLIELEGTKIAIIQVATTFGNTPESEASRCFLISGTMPTKDFGNYIVEEERP